MSETDRDSTVDAARGTSHHQVVGLSSDVLNYLVHNHDASWALAYLRPTLLAIDEVGYLTCDAHAADLLLQAVSRRYEQKSIVITTNLLRAAARNKLNAERIVTRSLVFGDPAVPSS